MMLKQCAGLFIFTLLVLLTSCDKSGEKTTEPSSDQSQIRSYPLVLNLKADQNIRSGFVVQTYSNEKWSALEGELGFVEAQDDQGNELGRAFLITEEDWMSGNPVKFTAKLIFHVSQKTKGKLVFTQNTAKENKEPSQFSVPVVFEK